MMTNDDNVSELKPALHDRMTVVETIYHNKPMEEARAIDIRFCRTLKSDEQLYERVSKVGKLAIPIDTGWLPVTTGALIITNLEGMHRQQLPSAVALEVSSRKVIEIIPHGSSLRILIPPKEGIRLTVNDASLLSIRCQSGDVKFRLVVVPE